MAGTVNEECSRYRPLLTEHLLLGTAPPQDASRHLEQCPECARETAEAHDVVRTLRRAHPLDGPAWPGAPAPAPSLRPADDLGDRIGREVARAEENAGAPGPRLPRRLLPVLLGLAAALASAAAVVPLSLDDGDPAPVTTPVAMVREGKMVDRDWGTEVPVALSGLKEGETYRMMTVNADGGRTPGGSVRAASSGEQVSTRMMTAMPRHTITALIVEDGDGRVVTRVPVRPATSPPPPAR